MEALETRLDFQSRRRRAAWWEYGMLAVGALPLFSLLLLPGWIGRNELFHSLEGRSGAIPYAVGLLWMFTFIIVSKYGWKVFGLFCRACGQRFLDDRRFEAVVTTGRCAGCGKHVLTDVLTPHLPYAGSVGALVTRAELTARYKAVRKRYKILALLAFLPALSYVGPLLLIHKSPFRDLGQPMDDIMGFAMAAVTFGILFYLDRTVWKRGGLTCDDCGHKFTNESFEITITSGRCGGCGKRVLLEGSAHDA